jgi:EAL domain-containing protein (putative c-di-GMP-specific phosphodiesterase class I)
MLEMLDASGVDCRILRFEITETDELQVSTTEIRLIEQLHKRGFRVWLDDVGTGYNSFDLLKRLHVDGIKIDRSFTHALVIDPVDHALTEALISIGKTMCLEIVAEGVEDEATYQALLDMNADAFQGHRFHRAESAADVLLNQAVAA